MYFYFSEPHDYILKWTPVYHDRFNLKLYIEPEPKFGMKITLYSVGAAGHSGKIDENSTDIERREIASGPEQWPGQGLCTEVKPSKLYHVRAYSISDGRVQFNLTFRLLASQGALFFSFFMKGLIIRSSPYVLVDSNTS